MNIGVKILALVAALYSTESSACIAPTRPIDPLDDPEMFLQNYPTILIGTIVGIDATMNELMIYGSYERWLAAESPSYTVADITMPHTLTILVHEKLRGDAKYKVEVSVGGCGVSLPKLGQTGLFLVEAGDESTPLKPMAYGIYADRHEDNGYALWVSDIKKLVRMAGDYHDKSTYFDEWVAEVKAILRELQDAVRPP